MIRTPLRTATALSFVGLLGTALAAGCGGEADLDLNTLDIAEEGSKADSLGTGIGDYAWTRAVPGVIQCIKAPCASTELVAVNAGTQRFVYRLDWRSLKLSAKETMDAEARAGSMLLYGRFKSARAFGEDVLVYQVTRANLPASERAADRIPSDRYYWPSASKDCVTSPQCTTLQAGLLNQPSPQLETWNSVDLTRLELSTEAEKTVQAEIKEGKDYVSAIGITAGIARASQIFRPFKATPLK